MKPAVAVEDHDRMFAAVEHKDPVARVGGDAGDLDELRRLGQLNPGRST